MLIMQDLLKLVVKMNASDLHLTAGRPPQLRIDGDLILTDLEVLTPETTRDLSYSILTEEQIETFEKKKELDITKDLIPYLVEKGYPVNAYLTDSYWYDVGSIEKFEKLDNNELEKYFNFLFPSL